MTKKPMKAILVAGGEGSRLLPFTKYTHKSLLPLFDKPVIDYALAIIRNCEIRDITIIGNRFIGQIAQHVGIGIPGEVIHYVIEESPKGVKNALDLARPHVEGHRTMVYFADNITNANLKKEAKFWLNSDTLPGALFLGRELENPESFGVAKFNSNGDLEDIIEKPKVAPSKVAIGGIYFYDERLWEIMDKQFDKFGDKMSISDVNREYINLKAAKLRIEGDIWIDCGTPENLLEAGILAKSGSISTKLY
jgi:glucose-1-phosphate thymidylyltransferase